MFLFILFLYILIVSIIKIMLLWKIATNLEKNEIQTELKENRVKRNMHPQVGRVNYNRILSGRKSIEAYDQYKNTSGLYEPVKPNNGIPIKKREE